MATVGSFVRVFDKHASGIINPTPLISGIVHKVNENTTELFCHKDFVGEGIKAVTNVCIRELLVGHIVEVSNSNIIQENEIKSINDLDSDVLYTYIKNKSIELYYESEELFNTNIVLATKCHRFISNMKSVGSDLKVVKLEEFRNITAEILLGNGKLKKFTGYNKISNSKKRRIRRLKAKKSPRKKITINSKLFILSNIRVLILPGHNIIIERRDNTSRPIKFTKVGNGGIIINAVNPDDVIEQALPCNAAQKTEILIDLMNRYDRADDIIFKYNYYPERFIGGITEVNNQINSLLNVEESALSTTNTTLRHKSLGFMLYRSDLVAFNETSQITMVIHRDGRFNYTNSYDVSALNDALCRLEKAPRGYVIEYEIQPLERIRMSVSYNSVITEIQRRILNNWSVMSAIINMNTSKINALQYPVKVCNDCGSEIIEEQNICDCRRTRRTTRTRVHTFFDTGYTDFTDFANTARNYTVGNIDE
jgi:hypothetical protein